VELEKLSPLGCKAGKNTGNVKRGLGTYATQKVGMEMFRRDFEEGSP